MEGNVYGVNGVIRYQGRLDGTVYHKAYYAIYHKAYYASFDLIGSLRSCSARIYY
jgi:hypothetical protein